ncbi:hypothetical protein ZIOFF_011432 [Zingiber officinale]|uniref:Uncharacterized protein n=1 Tax=Zingiber officinale TaxID=94328 RepID=A0A8J5I5T0_ZINOF|nr:hypothetical protein ZIOFF_011432 [Zingiber officinale]
MVKFSQEGMTKKGGDDSWFSERLLLLLLLPVLECFAMPKGGKLEKRLKDLCLHRWKKPCHSESIRSIWVSSLEVLSLGLVSKPFKSAYRNSSPESGSLSGSSVRSNNPSLGAPPFRALVPLLGLPSATSYSAPTGEHPKLLTLEVLASALSRELTTLQRCLVLSLANILFWAGNPTDHSVLGREPLRL